MGLCFQRFLKTRNEGASDFAAISPDLAVDRFPLANHPYMLDDGGCVEFSGVTVLAGSPYQRRSTGGGMQRSKPDRAPDVDAQTTLEDVFASRTFGKQLPDPLGLRPGSAMARCRGSESSRDRQESFRCHRQRRCRRALARRRGREHRDGQGADAQRGATSGAPGPVNPDFSNPAVSGSGTATSTAAALPAHPRRRRRAPRRSVPRLDDARQCERHRGATSRREQQQRHARR